MSKKEKLKIHTKPKQAVQLNRPLIITAAIIVVTALSLTVIGAFTTSKKTKSGSSDSTKTSKNRPAIISPELLGLPGSYKDVDGIKKYIAGTDNSHLMALVQKLDRLQQDHLMLKQQLASQNNNAPPTPAIDYRLEKAKKHSMVMPSLGSGFTNVGADANRNRKTGDEDLIATTAQGELIKQQERNKQKLAVMKGRDRPEEIYDMHNMVIPISPYQIQAGSLIPAALITGIDTTIEGTIIALVRSNLYDTVTGKYLLVPKGSKLLGKYSSRIITGQRRILLTFNRIVRPDGSSLLLGNPTGADSMGKSGVEGDVDNHWARIIGASTISTILSVGAAIGGGGGDSVRQRGFAGLGNQISGIGQQIAGRSINIAPTITLEPGHQFNVAVKRDMILTPYKPKAR